MEQERVRWGILGTASIARRRFLPAVAKSRNATVIAIGSRNQVAAEEFGANFNIAAPYGSYQEVLDDANVEVVYIPLPNHMHAEWATRAADAGKHVLCEKPMAVDADEALRLADHCARCGVLLMEGFMYRLNPRTLMIRQMIDQGAIGEVRSTYAEFGFTIDSHGNSRLIAGKGAGSLMDVGCYCVNASRYLMGSEPLCVLASQRLDTEIGCDMSTSAILEFEGGRTGLVNCSFETAFKSCIAVSGTAGVLRANQFFTPPESGRLSFTVETPDRQVTTHETDAVDQFLVEIEAFSDCVRSGRDVPLDPYAEAVANARVIDAVRESAGTRRPAEVIRWE